MKGLFSINLNKIINNNDLLIKINEKMFSQTIKLSRSCSLIRKYIKLMIICFSNSISLISAITSIEMQSQQKFRDQLQAIILFKFWMNTAIHSRKINSSIQR